LLVCLKKRIGTLWFNFGVKEKWNIIRCRGGVLHAAPAEVQLGACRRRTPDCDLLRRKKRRGENESKQRALRLFQGEKQARGKKGWRKKMQIKGGCSDCKYVTVDPCNYTTVLRFNKPLAHALDL